MISNILFQIPKYTRQNTKFDNLSLINNQKITVEPNKKVLTNDEISFKKLPSLEGFSVLKTVSLIEPKNGHKVPADIMSDFKPLKDSRTYYIVVNKEIIGEMLLTRVKNEDYGTFKNPEKCDFVKLIDIDTRKKYKNNIWKGAGFELFYTAFEESLKEGCGGRLRVFATTLDEETNPIKFYFSKGFRSCQPSTLNDNDIAKGNIPLKSRIFMYLPYERIKKLKENKPSCF